MTPAERAIIQELYEMKAAFQPYAAYCTNTQDLTFRRWNGKHPSAENTVDDIVPAGTTLKIVMVSRMGDAGLTDDLSATRGYLCRVDWKSGLITNIRWQP